MPSTLSYPGSGGTDWLVAFAVAVVGADTPAAAAAFVFGRCESVSCRWDVEDDDGGGGCKDDGDGDEEEEEEEEEEGGGEDDSVLSDTRTRPAARMDSTSAGTIS